MDAAAQQQEEMDRQKMAEQKQQDFDDFLTGKKDASEKNLQTLFKEFYQTAKKIDPKEVSGSYVNAAKSSLGGLSSRLEARRQKMKQMKEDAMNIDKEKTTVDKSTAEAKDKTEKQQVD